MEIIQEQFYEFTVNFIKDRIDFTNRKKWATLDMYNLYVSSILEEFGTYIKIEPDPKYITYPVSSRYVNNDLVTIPTEVYELRINKLYPTQIINLINSEEIEFTSPDFKDLFVFIKNILDDHDMPFTEDQIALADELRDFFGKDELYLDDNRDINNFYLFLRAFINWTYGAIHPNSKGIINCTNYELITTRSKELVDSYISDNTVYIDTDQIFSTSIEEMETIIADLSSKGLTSVLSDKVSIEVFGPKRYTIKDLSGEIISKKGFSDGKYW
jgi:hypothetical protein